MQSWFSNFSQLWVFLTGLCTFLSFSESSACPQVGSANLSGVLAGFPELWIPALYRRMHLCPALGCSVSPILMGLGVTAHRGWKGIPQLQSCAKPGDLPRIVTSSRTKPPYFCILFGCFGLPCAFITPFKFLPNQECRDCKACTQLPHILLVLWAQQSDIWQKYWIVPAHSSVRASPSRANSTEAPQWLSEPCDNCANA